MSDVDRLFEQYRQEHREGGEADPRRYLEQLEGVDRRELEALIDGYLMRAPGREWDAEAFEGSPAQRAAQALAAEWSEAPAVGWSTLLEQLRQRAQVKRSDLVAQLAAAIGHPEQKEKVRAYYHQMETGRLPSEGVSDRVLDALGSIVGETRERLRAAGSMLAAGGNVDEAREAALFARKAARDQRYEAAADEAPAPAAAAAEPAGDDTDEVDRLFTGGPAAGD